MIISGIDSKKHMLFKFMNKVKKKNSMYILLTYHINQTTSPTFLKNPHKHKYKIDKLFRKNVIISDFLSQL